MSTVAGFFDTAEAASGALDALLEQGVPRDHISLLSHEKSRQVVGAHDVIDIEESAGERAGKGALMGGLAGLVVGLGAVLIPGVGPLLAFGPLATALVSAGVGATAGGLLGGLTDLGIPEYEAEFYLEGIRRGGTLVLVKIPEGQGEAVAELLRARGAVDVGERLRHYHATGFVRHDPDAPPYDDAAIAAERAAVLAGVPASQAAGTLGIRPLTR